MTFKSDMAKAERIIINASEKCIRGTAIRLFGEIIRSTPVGNASIWKVNEGRTGDLIKPKGYVGGRLRGNWQATIDKPAEGTIDSTDPSGGRATASVQSAAQSYDLNKKMFLTNNLPYADRIENGAWSKQAPEGMVKKNVGIFKAEIERQARANRK